MPDTLSRSELTVVGIGASAGGLEAFRGFFENLPHDTGMAFVVLLHLPANRPSLLPEILGRWTRMRVRAAEDGDVLEPDIVYVPPPHATTVLRHGRLSISQPPADWPPDRRPIDSFFDTLAESAGRRAVGIVLSGNGSDGALGLKAIKARSGLTMAQGVGHNEEDPGPGPEYGDMPAAAVATGTVDLVAPVHELPSHLIRLRGVVLDDDPAGPSDAEIESLRLRICGVLREKVGHDFRGYKAKTFLRRVNRRMQVVNRHTLESYIEYLQADRDEGMLLFRDLLIRVTSFFRDEQAFEVIERVVIPRLFHGRHADGTVRVWVPGCATGEEAYSLAILLREHMDTMHGPPKVQIFGTDIDAPAIDAARLGRYLALLLEGLSDARRGRFFTASDGGYVVTREIRDLCTFSPHSLVRDPPFSRIDLISCRNLLIYLDSELQAAIMPAFHYSLGPTGILILGISETTARHTDLFEPIDKPARIYGRRDVRGPPLPMTERRLAAMTKNERARQPVQNERIAALDNDQAGRSTKDGIRASGAAAPRGLGGRLKQMVRLAAVRFYPEIGGAEDLRGKLQEVQDELQLLTEEHVTAIEELRSSNEELHSVNEELQSSNEELETSKEEIQSVNEELHTLNAQLSEKLEELDNTNSDLRNLFDSTQIATIFLDRHMVIRGFTPAVTGLYSLIPSDVGRPLTDIAGQLNYTTLRDDAQRVIETLAPVERQLSRLDGAAHYIMRMLPYRAPDSSVSGSLLTFLDVTVITEAEQHQRLLVDELNHRVKNMLTVVISMASQMLRRSTSLDDFGEAFMGRVHALSASYTLLSREHWRSVPLREVIEAEIRPFVAGARRLGADSNIQLSGEAFELVPTGALALGMAIHELATNAVKYGALSVAEGSVRVGWRIEGEGTGAELHIDWIEENGPPVEDPAKRGFGTLLIERSFSHELSGRADLRFEPNGLHAVLRAPVARVVKPMPRNAGEPPVG